MENTESMEEGGERVFEFLSIFMSFIVKSLWRTWLKSARAGRRCSGRRKHG
jgi:hypothetical protein